MSDFTTKVNYCYYYLSHNLKKIRIICALKGPLPLRPKHWFMNWMLSWGAGNQAPQVYPILHLDQSSQQLGVA